ncbi:MAG: hydrogenase expression/formation protein HypE [Armatimonadetes bacterium]|nr:hydrogenase expression/formation protein HypE [Armatimonadota bacterium]
MSDASDALDRIEKFRKSRKAHPVVTDKRITMSHGSGGKATHQLIEAMLLPALSNPLLDALEDQAVFQVDSGRLAFTTDSYVVDPIFFPGGDIGMLAVNGTVNDLATCGADPLYLSLALILEEGLEMDVLRKIVDSVAEAARLAGVSVVTGDTKVVPRGKADKLYINTAGVGVLRMPVSLSIGNARPGDSVLMSGPIGDHGIAVMAARGGLELDLDTESDSAPIHHMVQAVLHAAKEVRCFKDPTRGGVASSLNEIASRSGVCIAIDELAVPVRAEVRGACEILGIDPLYMANEGRLLCVVPRHFEDAALDAMRGLELGVGACRIGEVLPEPSGMVFVRTQIGGTRVLDMLTGDPLPRIC